MKSGPEGPSGCTPKAHAQARFGARELEHGATVRRQLLEPAARSFHADLGMDREEAGHASEELPQPCLAIGRDRR
jgi:hypothetical protein